jgi:hypothetical protein
MAGTTKGMNKIKQLLRFHLHGASNRKIAIVLEMDKETVNRYVLLPKRTVCKSKSYCVLTTLYWSIE